MDVLLKLSLWLRYASKLAPLSPDKGHDDMVPMWWWNTEQSDQKVWTVCDAMLQFLVSLCNTLHMGMKHMRTMTAGLICKHSTSVYLLADSPHSCDHRQFTRNNMSTKQPFALSYCAFVTLNSQWSDIVINTYINNSDRTSWNVSALQISSGP